MPLITTIIPAFNASKTITGTVRSALAQSHNPHEIIIVDDGSTDGTVAAVREIAVGEPRVRLLACDHQGVSLARNHGIAEAKGEFVALLDADDLWHPQKLARQLAVFEAMPQAALAYCWFRRIDTNDRVFPGSASPRVEGRTFHRHLDWNFISNGSTPLVRREVAQAIGFEPALTRGCEDYLFQLQVARRYPLACVPAWLAGYRRTPGSFSANALQMIDAHLQMYRLLLSSANGDADLVSIIAAQVARLEVERARNRGRRGHLVAASAALGRSLASDWRTAAATLGVEARRALSRARRPMFPPPARPFFDYDPDEPDGDWSSGRDPVRDAWLARLDARAA